MIPLNRRAVLYAFIGLLALALFILRDVLFHGGAFFERDLLFVYYPWIESFKRAIAEGALPLRDPSSGFGQAIMGNPSSQVLYPPTWLHLFLAPDVALSLNTLFHAVLGAAGASVFCWRVARSTKAGFLAGVFWMTSGPFLSVFNLWHHFDGAAWMPWVLAAFDGLLEQATPRRALALGALFGAQILAGSADMCIMTGLLALLRLACEGKDLTTAPIRRLSLMALGAGIVALALGAAVWMPVGELVRTSSRQELTRAARTEWSIHPLVATEFLLPTQIGTMPFDGPTAQRLTDGRSPLLKSLYLGPLMLPLILAGLMNNALQRRWRAFLFLGTLIAFLGALGRYTPVYDWLVTLAPPLALCRYPAKAALPLSLLVSTLAAVGVTSLDVPRARRLAVIISGSLIVVTVWLYMKAPLSLPLLLDSSRPTMVSDAVARLEPGLALAGIVTGLFLTSLLFRRSRLIDIAVASGVVMVLFANRDINPTVAAAILRFQPAHASLVAEPGHGRLYAFDYLHFPARSADIFNRGSLIVPANAQGLGPAAGFIVVVRSALMAPTGSTWGIEYAWDYDLVGLFDRSLRDLMLYMRNLEGHPGFLRMLQLANVTHVAALHASSFGDLALERTIPMPLPEPLYIFRVPAPLPRAYAVSGVRSLPTQEAMSAILDPAFQPASEVTLEGVPSVAISPTFESTVGIVERRSDRVSIDATLNQPGQVVLLEGFLPGWEATVDGVSTEVRRANALFVATEASAGTHRVVFSYRPRAALIGMALSALTAFALLVAGLRLRS